MVCLERYVDIVGEKVVIDLLKKVRKLEMKQVLNINSTFLGGGVSEILQSLMPLANLFGMEYEWRVLHGTLPFYSITKKMHNGLQGESVIFSENEKRLYEDVNSAYGGYTSFNQDFVVLHDPQPLPLVAFIDNLLPIIWRCHIDLSSPNEKLWDYLKQYIRLCSLVIVSREEYKKKDLLIEQRVVSPAIDPLSDKNKYLAKEQIALYLTKASIPMDKPIISQISRMDKWKDPEGLLEIYELVRSKVDCRLLYCYNSATDDPEGEMILNRIKEKAKDLIVRGDVILVLGDDPLLVNAIQSYSSIVVQKSIKEGFCLLPETKIITEYGYKEIQNINVGDKVLTEIGEFEFVEEIMSREVENYYKIQCWKGIEIEITGEHPVFAAKRRYKQNFGELSWIKVEDLKVGDYIATPIPKSEDLDLVLDLKDYDENLQYEDQYVFYKFGYSGKRELSYKKLESLLGVRKSSLEYAVRHLKNNTYPKNKKIQWVYNRLMELGYEVAEPERINRFIDIADKDIQWLCGLYIGNGSNNGRFIELCFNKNKLSLVERIKEIFKIKFNKESDVRIRDNKVTIYCSSEILVKFFKQFGVYAGEKHIPETWLKYGRNLRYLLVGLLDSDGSYNDTSVSYSSINEELIWQMWRICLSLKIPSKIGENKRSEGSFGSDSRLFTLQFGGKEYHKFSNEIISQIHKPLNDSTKRQANLCIILDDYILYPIRRIEEVYENVKVFDLKVKDIHSFVAGGYLVHNCLAVTEALWKETSVVASKVGGIPSQIIDGQTGFLVDPYDYQGFADRIIALIKNFELRRDLAEKAKEFVREKFLLTRLLGDYLNIFEEVL